MMAGGPRDDRILSLTWWVALLVSPVLAAAGVILYGFPLDTERLWAWPMGPEMTSLAVGGGYLAGAVLFVRCLWQRDWHRIGLVFCVATVLTVLLLIATLLHWESFSHQHPSFWAWLIVYLVTPVLLPVVWLRNRRYDPGVPAPGTPLVPRWVRAVVGVVGGAQVLVALVFFVRPALAVDVWPWDVTPLTTRTLAAFLAFIGAMWLVFLVESRWSALRLHAESATLGLTLVAVGAMRASVDFTAGTAATATFSVLLGGTLVGLAALLVGMRRLTAGLSTAGHHAATSPENRLA
jgi:hypothetical protein